MEKVKKVKRQKKKKKKFEENEGNSLRGKRRDEQRSRMGKKCKEKTC